MIKQQTHTVVYIGSKPKLMLIHGAERHVFVRGEPHGNVSRAFYRRFVMAKRSDFQDVLSEAPPQEQAPEGAQAEAQEPQAEEPPQTQARGAEQRQAEASTPTESAPEEAATQPQQAQEESADNGTEQPSNAQAPSEAAESPQEPVQPAEQKEPVEEQKPEEAQPQEGAQAEQPVDEDIRCPVCDKPFASKKQLNGHMTSHKKAGEVE